MSFYTALESFVKKLFDIHTAKMRTNTVCQVVAYDATTNLVNLQPCIMSIRPDDIDSPNKQLPPVNDIPVFQYGSGEVMITAAPAVGSYGLYVVSDRKIENWIVGGGIVTPGSRTKFDISDGFFLHGLFPTVVDGDNGKIDPAIATDRISIRTRDDTTKIDLTAAGAVTVTTTGQFSVNGNFTVDP